MVIQAIKVALNLINNAFYQFFSMYKNGKQLFSKAQRMTPKKAREKYQNPSKKKKTKGEKRAEKDMEILLKMKKKKSVSIIFNVIRIFLRNKSRTQMSI